MADYLISFGSNLGDGGQLLAEVLDACRRDPDIGDLRASHPYSTRPVGAADRQPNYVNAAFRLSTSLDPPSLLLRLRNLERRLGRIRSERWGPRRVDLDLLLHDRESFRATTDGGELVIPHPRMTFRRFVLQPAADVAADMYHPLARMTIGELLSHLDSQPNAIAIVGDRRAVSDLLDRLTDYLAASHSAPASGLEFSFHRRSAIDRRELPAQGNQFALIDVIDRQHWDDVRHQIKLLVYWRADAESAQPPLVPVAIGEFAGPRLELESQREGDAARELAAAMAAMLPQSLL